VTVDGPPGSVKHLIEIRGVVALDGKTPRERGIDVRVALMKAGMMTPPFASTSSAFGYFARSADSSPTSTILVPS
jgi:hypothetical protein